MAKYAYAPLSIDDNGANARGRRNSGGHHGDNSSSDNLVSERMPMCVGICVLLAIVFVLSRSGERENLLDTHQELRHSYSNPTLARVPDDTSPVLPPSSINTNTVKNVPIPAKEKTVTVTSTKSSTSKKSTSTKSSSSSSSSSSTTTCTCDGTPTSDSDVMGILREKALANSPPHIIECAKAKAGESQAACHLPRETRFAALRQKGATLWMTGCSGAGKTTIATALEEQLVKQYGKHVYRLDGDNLRTGLNRDLGFSEADRAEAVRRAGEMATLFSDAGVITIVGLISPFAKDRDLVRERHQEQGIPFYEVFLDVPIDELKKRDPKGQYARVDAGELKHFTCIDDPYEAPPNPEIVLKTQELAVEESVRILFRRLELDGILTGAPKVAPPGLPNPDGDVLIDLHVPDDLKEERRQEAEGLPKVLITDIDLNWLQVIGEGWAAPLRGFMRQGALLEALHFNSILTDPFNLTGNELRLSSRTDFVHFPLHPPPQRVSMSVPITLSCSSYTKDAIENSKQRDVALVTQMGQIVAIMRDVEIYDHRKEEIVTRLFGIIDPDHPYISYIYKSGDYLLGGEVELLDRIRYNDGLDKWRKTTTELYQEFKEKGADTVYAFQTRNPTHSGHAYLMRSAGKDLIKQGYRNPVLWLSPLGGWTKSDDVPLDVRVKQHEEVLNAGLSHPGGLDPETTVMAIWPSPMFYAGPTEVQFHAKSRRCAGASYFVVGRDPAGMKGSPNAVAHADDDLYDGDHGRYVLQYSPGVGDMQFLAFSAVDYDITDNVMKIPDPSRPQDFISISGTKMRTLAQNGAVPCSKTNIPTDLVKANCVPSGFMVPKGWDIVVDYYKHAEDSSRWIPWSQPRVKPPAHKLTKASGVFGTTNFTLSSTEYESWWHDLSLHTVRSDKTVVNMVVEIPKYVTAKMEMQKKLPGNPIAQDTNSDGSPRYYKYGTPFFNYGFLPQTWEDPYLKTGGYGGDNDPLDVIEIGSSETIPPLQMGSVTPCKILGSLELIDQGETDHKVICIAKSDPKASRIDSIDDLEEARPGIVDKLRDWLTRYKTSDGKGENRLAEETPKTIARTLEVIAETHERWKTLCDKFVTSDSSTGKSKTKGFWLESPGCAGTGSSRRTLL